MRVYAKLERKRCASTGICWMEPWGLKPYTEDHVMGMPASQLSASISMRVGVLIRSCGR
jgi:hypothetical protein